MTSRIPTFDIRRFTHPVSAEDRQAFVDELGAAYREWGFAGIRNHGIPQAQIDQAYRTFKAFFALPEDTKKQYHVAGGGGARGYTPFGVETAKGSKHFDLKEFWHIGREIPRDSKYAADMPENQWPTETPEFKRVGYGLYETLDALGSQVLAALALHIGLPETYFADKNFYHAREEKQELLDKLIERNELSPGESSTREILDPQGKPRWRQARISFLKNRPYHQHVTEYLTLLGDEQVPEILRVRMAEALAWFNLSVRRHEIADAGRKLLARGNCSPELAKEVQRMINRVESKK